MKLLIAYPALQMLAGFSHLPQLRTPLEIPCSFFSPANVRQGLSLPAAADAPWQPVFAAGRALVDLPCVRRLPPPQRQLLWRTLFLLRPHDVTVHVKASKPYGVQLTLHRGGQNGQVVIYHKATGAWSKAEGEGPRSALTREAVRILNAPLPRVASEVVATLPEDAPLPLVAVYAALLERARRLNWDTPWMSLSPGNLKIWFSGTSGKLAHFSLAHGPGDSPVRLRRALFESPASLDVWRAELQGLCSAQI